jgi:DNA invertase Pin-like site-specific DNA recombinase
MNAVIYARYSTDKQRETSIDDQSRVCRSRAELLQFAIVAVHADDGISGSIPVAARPGGRALLADLIAGRFQVLLLESLDRLSRDLVEQETIVRRLEHRGVRIIGCSDGYDTTIGTARKIHRGMRGLINEIYLDDLRAKVHRGLVGQISRGYHAGGISYGYRSIVAAVGAKGEPLGHRLEIDEEAAKWVTWIFTNYVDGWSCQRLAAELNAQRVRSPRGNSWVVSALYGSPAKGSGVLNNEIYIGRYIWNRSQWVKDPDSGKRQRIVRPRQEWCIEERPELRILSDDLWKAARRRLDRSREQGGSKGKGATPRTLFGGLMRCGHCGGAVVAIDGYCYGCVAHKDRGQAVCAGLRARRRDIDARLLSVVRDELMSPSALAELENAVRELSTVAATENASRRDKTKQRRAELDREISNLVQAVATMGISRALSDRLACAERERDELDREAKNEQSADQRTSTIVPRYKRLVADLQGALAQDVARSRAILREIFGEIRLVETGPNLFAEFESPLERLVVAAGGAKMGLVAGEGFGAHLRVPLDTKARRYAPWKSEACA